MFDGFLLLPVRLTAVPMHWITVGLWLAVVASGLYHGINPGMGWPLAVSAGLMGRGRQDLGIALVLLAAGHMLAMLVILLPFALVSALLYWQHQIRGGASATVVAFGIFRLINRRHPRALVRITPTQLALWCFAIATAHGAGLMLLPIYLGLCSVESFDAAHRATSILVRQSLGIALLVSAVHALAMVAAGGLIALLVHDWLGLRFLSRTWFNLDLVWAVSLVLIGSAGLMEA